MSAKDQHRAPVEAAMIIRAGRPALAIAVAQGASEAERYAASELRNYLNLMGSISMPMADETAVGPMIAIGAAAARLGLVGDPQLGDDGFTIRTVGDSLAIVGGRRGVIYGVYELLERLGCRFFTPLAEKVPSMADVALPQVDATQRPVLEYRHHNYTDFMRCRRFAVKSRLNGGALDACYGGGVSYVWFVHSFEPNILDSQTWFDTHPEYFSEVGGKRVKDYTQLCLTHPDVLQIAIEKVRTVLRAHPECRILSLSQNDWGNPCSCPACARIDTEEGSHAGALIRFVNRVAEAVETEFPEVVIDTLAYQYSRPAPRLTRPRHNVCVRLCTIEACFAHPLATCDDPARRVQRPDGSSSSFIRDLEEWARVCNRLYIWDYTTGFAHYPAPHPNWNVLQPNMRAFVRNNVKGVFEQACGAVGGGTDLNELRAYVIAKLLWDAECDVPRHIAEFTDFYYGAAAPAIRGYIGALTACVERGNIHVGFNDARFPAHLSGEWLDQYDAFFDEAEQAVAGDPLRAVRVARARLSLRWVRLKSDAMLTGLHDAAAINRFFEDWRAHGLTRIDEWVSAETTHRALIEDRWRGVEYYKHWSDEGAERL